MRHRLLKALLAGSVLALAASPALARTAPSPAPAAQSATAPPRLAQSGRWLVDSQGRVVQLRGGNVTLPAFSTGEPRWTANTPRLMADQGFNGVRLVVFFSQIMPRPGQIDTAYLDRIGQAVAAYKAQGLYTLIDFHQDEYGPLVGVRGLPDWAVFTDGHTRSPDIKFPIGYFEDAAVQHAFDNFWANHPVPGAGKGVQDLYVEGLIAVARRFANEPAVVGIDVMNEPATGSRCAKPDPDTAHCPQLETELLKPFYEKAARAINTAAPSMIVFVEPFMLQGALGTPINTPVAGAVGRRGLSFHNYGPVQATRDRVSDGALAVAARQGAAIINTEWGFSNDPAEVAGQAGDFDARLIPWLAWTRGSFEALVDTALPDEGNGDRVAILRAYARPYPQATAGTPQALSFDPAGGVMTYRYATKPLAGRAPRGARTRIAAPAIQFPQGYTVVVKGGRVVSAVNASMIEIENAPKAPQVLVTLTRVGQLTPRPTQAAGAEAAAALRALPPIPDRRLDRTSMLGHIVLTPGGREVLDRQVPGMLKGLSHVAGWEKMSLASIQKFASATLNDTKLAAIDADLSALKVTPGPVQPSGERLSLDSLTSDLLADPRARAILDREAPGLSNAPQQSLFPQTRLRNLQPVLPQLLTKAALDRIAAGLAALP